MNPLIKREFVGILRTRQAFSALVALSIAFSVLVLARWPTDARVDLSGSQPQQVFRVFAYSLLAGVVLLVPAFPAVSIVREKNKGTLALLINSPLKSWSIYLGKLGGVFLFTLFLIMTSLPAAAACYAMGGIELVKGFGLLYAVLLMLAVQYATLGLLVSSAVQSVDGGVRVTYALVFSMGFLALGPSYVYQGTAGLLATVAQWLRYLSPIPIIMDIVGHGDVGRQGLMTTESGVPQFFLLGALTSIAFAVATISRLNYRIFDRSRDQGVITQERSLAGRSFRRFLFLVDPQRRKTGIPWYLNPVMVKEFRTRRFGRFHWLLRLVAVCAVTSLLLTFAATTETMDWGVKTIGGLMVLLQVVLVVLITPSLSAGLVSNERETGGWEILRMTPMSGFKIIRGKLLSVAWTLVLVLFATLPGYLVMIVIEPVMWLQIYLVCMCLLLTALFTLLLSAAVGSLFSKTATATATAYIILMFLFLGPLLIWLGRDAPFGYSTVKTALLATPMGAALSVMETPGFAQYDLLPASWWITGCASLVMVMILAVQTWRLMAPK